MNQTKAVAGPAIDRAFLAVAENHRQGALITDVSAALKQVTAAVQLAGKGGKVTLEMMLKPASRGDAGTLVLEHKVKVKVPELEPAGSIFYSDPDMNLVREDPKQAKLPLRELEQEAPELRKV